MELKYLLVSLMRKFFFLRLDVCFFVDVQNDNRVNVISKTMQCNQFRYSDKQYQRKDNFPLNL